MEKNGKKWLKKLWEHIYENRCLCMSSFCIGLFFTLVFYGIIPLSYLVSSDFFTIVAVVMSGMAILYSAKVNEYNSRATFIQNIALETIEMIKQHGDASLAQQVYASDIIPLPKWYEFCKLWGYEASKGGRGSEMELKDIEEHKHKDGKHKGKIDWEKVYTANNMHAPSVELIKKFVSSLVRTKDFKPEGAKFSDLHLEGEDFSNANFSGADLTRARFHYSDLREADFCKAILHGAKFQDASLSNTKFYGAIVNKADLSGSYFDTYFINLQVIIKPSDILIVSAYGPNELHSLCDYEKKFSKIPNFTRVCEFSICKALEEFYQHKSPKIPIQAMNLKHSISLKDLIENVDSILQAFSSKIDKNTFLDKIIPKFNTDNDFTACDVERDIKNYYLQKAQQEEQKKEQGGGK